MATKMGLKRYAIGTAYNGGIIPTITGTGTNPVGYMIPYQTTDGTWFCKGSARCTAFTNASDYQPSIVPNMSVATFAQAGSIVAENFVGVPCKGSYGFDGGNFITSLEQNQPWIMWAVKFDFQLASKPTWAY
jgi:hypothetical protein